MTPLYGHSALVADFVAKLIPGCERGFGACTAIGVIDQSGKLVAGAVYHNWEPKAGVIEMSSAAITKRWMTRPVLRAIFGYPFDQLGCQLIVFRVAPTDRPLRRIFRALGCNEYVIPRLRGRDKATVLFTLADDVWKSGKFMRQRNEQT